MERKVFAAGAMVAGLGVRPGRLRGARAEALGSPEMLSVLPGSGIRSTAGFRSVLALAWAIGRWPERRIAMAAWLLLAGTLVFSGSLYILVLDRITLVRSDHTNRRRSCAHRGLGAGSCDASFGQRRITTEAQNSYGFRISDFGFPPARPLYRKALHHHTRKCAETQSGPNAGIQECSVFFSVPSVALWCFWP